MIRRRHKLLVLVVFAWSLVGRAAGADVLDLSGDWKIEEGDDPAWAAPDFDDSTWETIRVPGGWAEQGFKAPSERVWYRYTFEADAEFLASHSDIGLYLGEVSNANDTWVNGVLVGKTGDIDADHLPATVQSAYRVPSSLLKPGRNVVAVRVLRFFGQAGVFADSVFLGRYGDVLGKAHRNDVFFIATNIFIGP